MSFEKESIEREEKNMGILNFVLIGAKSSGKTIYLATLWGEGLLMNTHKEDKKYLDDTWSYIKKHGQAEASSGMFKILRFSYAHSNYGRVNFSIDDYDGTFTETISIEDENTKEEREKLLKSVAKSEGIFFFLPYEKDPDRFQDFAQEIDAFIQLAQKSSFNMSPIPASIVVTKWDESPNFRKNNEIEYVLEYIESNDYLKRALKLVRNNFLNTTIIPASSFKNYNLLKSIDYSLDNTFKLWYETTQKLYNEKKYDKLLKYLSVRYNDTKFNQVYDFSKLYDEVQELYIEDIKKELLKKDNYQEKEKYLEDISFYYQSKKELLKPLFEEVSEEKKYINSQKRKNIIVWSSILVLIVVGVWQYMNKLEVEERYANIIDNYEKNVSYSVLKENIEIFLRKYKNASFMYTFADIPSKRKKIQIIENDLKEKNRKSIKDRIEVIKKDTKLSADEKKQEIEKLRSQVVDGSQKIELDKDSEQFTLKSNTKKWQNEADDCLQNGKGEKGIENINKLLSIVKDSTKIISSDKVNEKIAKLIDKKKLLNQSVNMQNIFKQIESANSTKKLNHIIIDLENNFQNNKKVKEKIIASYLSIFNDTDSLKQLTDVIALIPDFIFSDSRVHDKAVSVVRLSHTEYFHTYRGTKLLDELKIINVAKAFNEYIKKDIDPFITAKEKYEELLKEISVNDKYKDLQGIDYSAYNSFENFEKEKIKTALTNSINKSFDTLYGEKPNDKFQLTERSLWLDNIKKIDNFAIPAIEYTYHIPSDKKADIKSIEEENDSITKLKNGGISFVKVTLIGLENNSLEFKCGWNYLGRRDDISISGFSSNLDYASASQCQNNSITYNYTITLEPIWYYIDLTDSGLKDDILSESISFTLEDLYELNNGAIISKMIDGEKLKLEFRKS